MVPVILSMMWAAQRLARLHSVKKQYAIAAAFTVWNLWAFHHDYLYQYENEGSNTGEFRAVIFHDNGRDFRPFQKILGWGTVPTGCLAETPWVEDDRFKLPFDFLRLTSGPVTGGCKWNTADLFFSHIPNYDPAFKGERTDANTSPPEAAPNVKFLAHFPEWGDLLLDATMTRILYKVSTRTLLILAILVAFVPFLDQRVLRMAGDEKVYLTQAVEMARDGRWFVQTLADEPSYFKGPMHYLFVRAGMLVFGDRLIAGTWMNCALALLAGLAMYRLGRKRWNDKSGLLLGLATALNVGVFSHTYVSQMEVEVTAFYAFAVAALGMARRKADFKYDLFFWLAAGLAGWSKSPLHSVLIACGSLMYWTLTRRHAWCVRAGHRRGPPPSSEFRWAFSATCRPICSIRKISWRLFWDASSSRKQITSAPGIT